MKILLYSPDNGVTRNYMPHLWMFLLRSLTPPGHEVELIDGNAQPLDAEALGRYVRDNGIGLVGIGAMTRMVAKAYAMADAVRAVGVPVVMGGPHVTELPDEPLGRDGGPQHADAVALGEADETWPRIVEDAARGQLQAVYKPVDAEGKDRKPSLDNYPIIPWDELNLDQFDLVPAMLRPLTRRLGAGWGRVRLIPIETGRGCPYGCDFCTVTGFFGDSIRYRSNESIVEELLRLKARARRDREQFFVFFVDDNLAINVKRAKSLLRAIIAAKAQLPWVAQVSANLLRDEELLDLIAESEGRCIFIGMESIDPENMASVNKQFSKPEEYGDVLGRLAKRQIFAITSFIFGLDNDRPGVAKKTLDAIASWPPGLPVFGALTPYPGTPLHDRLLSEGRLTRPRHWMDFKPFILAHEPTNLEADKVAKEIRSAWLGSYSPEANQRALASIADEPMGYRLAHLIARLFFRGIYFPQLTRVAWARVLMENRKPIRGLVQEGFGKLWRSRKKARLAPPATLAADRSDLAAPPGASKSPSV